LIATLRAIAYAVPIRHGDRFEDYPEMAARLCNTAKVMVDRVDAAIRAEAAQMERQRKKN